MKKLTFILTTFIMVVSFFSSVFAQSSPIDEGSMMAAGGVSFSNSRGDLYEDADDNLQTMIALSPVFSCFFIPGLATGGEFTFLHVSQGDWNYTNFGIGPQVRYYFVLNREQTEAKGSTYPYISVNFLYGIAKSKSDFNEDKYTYTSFGFRLGTVYMISNAVGVFSHGGLDIDTIKPERENSVSGNVFSFDIGFAYFIY